MTDTERFMKRVVEDEESGCWDWKGARTDVGVALFSPRGADGKPRSVLAQRWAFENLLRPLRPGQVIRTLCGDRECLNPEHLLAVTRLVAKGLDRGRCGRGHELTEENSLETRAGTFCRVCHGANDDPALPSDLGEVA